MYFKYSTVLFANYTLTKKDKLLDFILKTATEIMLLEAFQGNNHLWLGWIFHCGPWTPVAACGLSSCYTQAPEHADSVFGAQA